MQKFITFLFLIFVVSACYRDTSAIVSEEQVLQYSLEAALADASPTGSPDYFLFPSSEDLKKIPQDPKNPLTREKIELGRELYHDPGLGIHPVKPVNEYTYSCASCHHVAAGFQAGRRQGIGEGGKGFGVRGEGRDLDPDYLPTEIDVQPIRTPTALNVAFQDIMLWNGQFGATGANRNTRHRWAEGTPLVTNHLGYEGVETQAIAGLTVHRMGLDSAWVVGMGYQELFDKAFPSWEPLRRYSREAAGLAIAAYERTLMAQEAPFQRWLAGDKQAMTEQEIKGALYFFGKAGCVSCHTGPALNKEAFYALGMPDLEGFGIYGNGVDDKTRFGRGGFTGNEAENFQFKVPQLYNLKDSPFLGHGGNYESVEEVIHYKNRAIPGNPLVPQEALSPQFQPLGLSDDEVEAISVFLRDALYDPNLIRYVPSTVLSGFCFPNNDQRSREDLGCY